MKGGLHSQINISILNKKKQNSGKLMILRRLTDHDNRNVANIVQRRYCLMLMYRKCHKP